MYGGGGGGSVRALFLATRVTQELMIQSWAQAVANGYHFILMYGASMVRWLLIDEHSPSPPHPYTLANTCVDCMFMKLEFLMWELSVI